MNLIACAHPGKIGDALWALPAVRELCRRLDARCDFYTSDYCRPVKPLLEALPFIRQVVIPAGYEIKSMDCGVQPWQMPVPPEGYLSVHQMGFQGSPGGCIGEHIAGAAGLPREIGCAVQYEIEPMSLGYEYVVIASRGETTYADRFREFARRCRLPCLEVGAQGQHVIPAAVDHCGCDMLKMARLIAGAKAFVGIMSAPLVIANGWSLPKIVPHNGVSWDMSHVLYTPSHHYMIEPTADDMLRKLYENI